MELRDRIVSSFSHDVGAALAEQQFNGLALDVFAFQFEHNKPYRAYCERRQRTPATVDQWTHIPPVPTAAFKEVALVAGSATAAERVFYTSGTTRGAEKRGAHHILDLDLYHQALLPIFKAYLLPDVQQLPFISLIPPASQLPESSLSEMITFASGALSSRSDWLVDAERGLNVDALISRLEEVDAAAEPVCLLGTSFAFVHAIDSLEGFGMRFQLPAGSRIMDTGGFKGKSRTVPADELRHAYSDYFGIAATHCVNEYGMTEMCSQFYDSTLRDALAGRIATARIKMPPPWVRTRVVDPETLEPVPPGQIGLLQHFDLANLFSVLAIQTEDLGREHEQGFETLGRVEGAAPRGCSIATDLLLSAARGRA